MKTMISKIGLTAFAMLGLVVSLQAQTQPAASGAEKNRAHYGEGGKSTVQTNFKGKFYKLELRDDKIESLSIDGVNIPQSDWGKHKTELDALMEQVKKDREQARKDQAQALLDQQQARKDQERAKLDQEQARKDQERAKLDQEQAKQDQVQVAKDMQRARLDQERAKKDQERARLDQIQAGKDQERAKLDQERARKDQERAMKDQVQAKKDQEQARKDQLQAAEDQKMLNDLIDDLVSDRLVSSKDAVTEIKMSKDTMTINGKAQSAEVHKKYTTKYPRLAKGEFTYNVSGSFRNIRYN